MNCSIRYSSDLFQSILWKKKSAVFWHYMRIFTLHTIFMNYIELTVFFIFGWTIPLNNVFSIHNIYTGGHIKDVDVNTIPRDFLIMTNEPIISSHLSVWKMRTWTFSSSLTSAKSIWETLMYFRHSVICCIWNHSLIHSFPIYYLLNVTQFAIWVRESKNV